MTRVPNTRAKRRIDEEQADEEQAGSNRTMKKNETKGHRTIPNFLRSADVPISTGDKLYLLCMK
jgi:hypothetical protein